MSLKSDLREKLDDLVWELARPFKRFFNSLKTTLEWLPIIWNDRHDDQVYLYKILQFKIRKIREHHETCKYGRAKKLRKSTRLCELLLNRLINDDYLTIAFMSHDRKWGDYLDVVWEKSDTPGYVTMALSRSKVTPETKEQERKEFLQWCKHQDLLERQDIDMLFNTLKKHIQKYWC